jgi:hypothetical protein
MHDDEYLLVVLGLVLLWNLVKLACHGYHSNQPLLSHLNPPTQGKSKL